MPIARSLVKALARGLSYPLLGRGVGVDPADFPALLTWFKFSETSGTILADETGNVPDMTVTNGTGDAFANTGYVSSNVATSTYLKTATYAPEILRTLGSSAVLFEIAGIFTEPASGNQTLVALGTGTTDAMGIEIQMSSTSRLLVRIDGASISGGYNDATLSAYAAGLVAGQLTGAYCHLLVGYRGGADTAIDFYLNGVLLETATLTKGVSGDINITAVANNNLRLGVNQALTGFMSNQYDELRIWKLDSYPANISAIAAQMAANPNTLPALLYGVT